MKNRRTLIKSILVCLVLLGVVTCSPIPIETIEWQPDGNGFIQYKTNDPANAVQGFAKLYDLTANLMPVEVTAKRVLGSDGGGFGVVFNASDDQNYLKVLINVQGMYKIERVIAGGDYDTLKDWTYSSALKLYHDVENTIKITWAASPDLFTLVFNDSPPITISDSLVVGAQSGFYAYVSTIGNEYLPAGQVDVRFKMVTPVAIP